MKNRKVIVYASRHLKSHERNYRTCDLKLALIVFVLKFWKYNLFGMKYEIFADHQRLKYIFTWKELNLRQKR